VGHVGGKEELGCHRLIIECLRISHDHLVASITNNCKLLIPKYIKSLVGSFFPSFFISPFRVEGLITEETGVYFGYVHHEFFSLKAEMADCSFGPEESSSHRILQVSPVVPLKIPLPLP
jgi:hypothetical protein